MEPISFETRITYRAFLNIALYRYSRSWVVWFLYILCISLILLSIFAYEIPLAATIAILVVSSLVMVLIPARFLFRVRKAYKSNPFIDLPINWTISESSVAFKQGSVSAEVGWDRITKISDSKDWIMLWYSNRKAYYLNKTDFSPMQISDFKKIIHQMRKGYLKH